MTTGHDRPAGRARIPRWVFAAMVCAAVALVAFGLARLLTPPAAPAPRAPAATDAIAELTAPAPGADVTGGEPASAAPSAARVARALSRSAPPVAGPLTRACRDAATASSAVPAPPACDTRAWKPTARDAAATLIALRADAWREAALAHSCPGVEDCRTRLAAALGLLGYDPQRIRRALRGAGDTPAVSACVRAQGAAIATACAFPAPAGRPIDPAAAAELVTRLEADAELTPPVPPAPPRAALPPAAVWLALAAAATAGVLLGLLGGVTLATRRRDPAGAADPSPDETAPPAPAPAPGAAAETRPPAPKPARKPGTSAGKRKPAAKLSPPPPEPAAPPPAVMEAAAPAEPPPEEASRDAALERFRLDLALPVAPADFRAQALVEAAALDDDDEGARLAGGAIIAADHFAGDAPTTARAPAYQALVATLAGPGHRLVWPAAGTPADADMETVARGPVYAHAVDAVIRPGLIGPDGGAAIVRPKVLLR